MNLKIQEIIQKQMFLIKLLLTSTLQEYKNF